MHSHIAKGKGFGGVLSYLSEGRRDQPSDKKAEILGSKGVNTNSTAELIADFELGRNVNPRVNYAVWHTSLSFNPDDEARLTNPQMLAFAEGYLKKMGLENTQYLIVRHHDRPDNQHLHLVANLVDNQGKSIKTGRDFYHSGVALKALVEEHGLTPAGPPRPALQHPERFRKTDLARHEMLAVANPAVLEHTQRRQLLATLKQDGIGATVHVNKEGKEIGISFTKDGCTIKGSLLGPHLSLAQIDKQLAANELKQRMAAAVTQVATIRSTPTAHELISELWAEPASPVGPKSPATTVAAATKKTGDPEAVESAQSVAPCPAPRPSIASLQQQGRLPAPVANALRPVVTSGPAEVTGQPVAPADNTKPADGPPPIVPAAPAVSPAANLLVEPTSRLPQPPPGVENQRALPALSLAEMLVSAVPDHPAVATPAVAWQYGTIRLTDSEGRTSEDRMSAVRADLTKAGAQVKANLSSTPGQLPSTLLPYRFDPKMPDLEKVTTVLNKAQASDNCTVREQVHL